MSPEASKWDNRTVPVSPAKFVSPRTVALYGVLTALTAAVTYASYAPFSPTKGYFNIGESMVFFSALTFGWRAGMICGGIGSAAADVLLGSGMFAPITLVAKGAEGFVAGILGRTKTRRSWVIVLAIAAGGACMVTTYFVAEWLVLNVGFGKALAEVPINIAQMVLGGTIGALLSYYVKKSYPSLTPA
jgi:uncharacterized membrane protein